MKSNLQNIRKAAGYTSAKSFAESIGMSVETYTQYEQGQRNMSLEVAWELADALDCTLDELAGRKRPSNELLDEHKESLNEYYESMNEHGRVRLAEHAEMMAKSGMFAKSEDHRVAKTA